MQFMKYTHKKAACIEIVPMIDAIFFLLVYFMIASLSTSAQPAEPVNLPQASQSSERRESAIIVSVALDGQCFVGQSPVAMSQLKASLQAKLSAGGNLTVLINCDRDQSVAVFNHIFDLVKQANPMEVMVANESQSYLGSPCNEISDNLS